MCFGGFGVKAFSIKSVKKHQRPSKLFSEIRNGSHPKKTTAISLCIALELSYDETNELLIKAGYILNNSEKFDVIISYFLKKKNYDIYQINEALLYYDQPQLGIA